MVPLADDYCDECDECDDAGLADIAWFGMSDDAGATVTFVWETWMGKPVIDAEP